MILIAVQKTGGELDHPMGSARGNATSGPSVGRGDKNAQFKDILQPQPDVVETVGQINLGQIDRSILLVGFDDATQ